MHTRRTCATDLPWFPRGIPRLRVGLTSLRRIAHVCQRFLKLHVAEVLGGFRVLQIAARDDFLFAQMLEQVRLLMAAELDAEALVRRDAPVLVFLAVGHDFLEVLAAGPPEGGRDQIENATGRL